MSSTVSATILLSLDYRARVRKKFKETLSKIKPAYEVALKVRTQEEFEKEIIEHKTVVAKEKQEAFVKYVEELKEKLGQKMMSAEQYRNLIMEYKKRQSNN